MGSFHQAEDATQETLIRAWRALPSYQAKAPFVAWLYSIATNTCLMMIRVAGRRPRSVEDLSHLGPYPDQLLASPHGLSDSDRTVLARFVAAWQTRDIKGLTAVLAEDAILRMPPEPVRFDGPVQIVGFLSTVPADGRLDLIPLVPTRANGQPALAAYGPDPAEDGATAYGVMVFQVAGQQISRITGFADPDLFDGFGLPHRYAAAGTWLDDRSRSPGVTDAWTGGRRGSSAHAVRSATTGPPMRDG